ncbi:MAG: CBS domain-containing protein [Rhodobacteraceae bacterium]|nr:CBS domain-containing protein [Paracoccaceae bacterium]
MTVKIAELMAKRVITSRPHETVGHVRDKMQRSKVHSIPIVGPQNEPLGIVTTADLARRVKDSSPVSRIMTRDIVVVPAYNDVSVAARIMRKHKIHHVIVTHEKQVVGLISSFDLLKLLEGKRFVMSNAPTPPKNKRA